MSKELTDKIFVMVLRNGFEVWLNDAEAKLCKQAVKNGLPFLEIESDFIRTNAVEYITTAAKHADTIKMKRGLWKCSQEEWHDRKQAMCECWKDQPIIRVSIQTDEFDI